MPDAYLVIVQRTTGADTAPSAIVISTQGHSMQSGDVVPLFQGKRGNRPQRDAWRNSLRRVWMRITSFAVAVAEVARESRELEKRLAGRRGYRSFDH